MSLTGMLWLDIFLVLAALLTALGIIWKLLVKPLWKAMAKTVQLVQVTVPSLEALAEVSPVILKMAAEFDTNGGKSLRDAVNRLEKGQWTIDERMLAMEKYVRDAKHALANATTIQQGPRDLLVEQVSELNDRLAVLKKEQQQQENA